MDAADRRPAKYEKPSDTRGNHQNLQI